MICSVLDEKSKAISDDRFWIATPEMLKGMGQLPPLAARRAKVPRRSPEKRMSSRPTPPKAGVVTASQAVLAKQNLLWKTCVTRSKDRKIPP